MDNVTFITPTFAVTASMTADDFREAADLGFQCIVSNLPDGEVEDAPTAREEAVSAWRSGMAFAHVPVSRHDVFSDAAVERMSDVLRRAAGPVLAHCKSGTRSAILWAAASARAKSVDCVLDATRQAGFDLEFLREELEQQAERKHWLGGASATLDCGSRPKSAHGLTHRPSRADIALIGAAAHAL